MDILDGGGKLLTEVLPLQWLTGGLVAVAVHHAVESHFAQHHLRVVKEILVNGYAGFCLAKMYPIRLNSRQLLSLLQKEDVGCNLSSGVGKESIIRQTDRAQQIGPLRKIPAHAGVCFIQRPLARHKGNDAARPHLVQRAGEKVVMDQKMVFVVPLVTQAITSEWYVPNSEVEKAVRQFRFLKALHGNRGILIELAGDAPRDGVEFHAIQFAFCHALGHQTEKVTDTAGRLQNISATKAEIFHSLVDGSDDSRRGIVCVERRCPCRAVFLLRQCGS